MQERLGAGGEVTNWTREGVRSRCSLKPVMEQTERQSSGNADAAADLTFAEVYDTHVDEVYRFVHRRCRDHALAEDVTQETFMTAIRSVDDPRSISIGWLLTVARNRLIDVLRRQTRYEGKLRIVGVADTARLDAELAERLRVERALSELSVDHRLVLTLHYVDGFTVPAMAEHLGRSVKSVEGLVTRARRELRKQLGESSGVAGSGGGHG